MPGRLGGNPAALRWLMLKYKPRWAFGVYAIICTPISFLLPCHVPPSSHCS
jgi:hypothetical protein